MFLIAETPFSLVCLKKVWCIIGSAQPAMFHKPEASSACTSMIMGMHRQETLPGIYHLLMSSFPIPLFAIQVGSPFPQPSFEIRPGKHPSAIPRQHRLR